MSFSNDSTHRGHQDDVSWRYALHADGRLDLSAFTPTEAAQLDALWIITAALRRYLIREPAEAVIACSVSRDYFDAVHVFATTGFHTRPEPAGRRAIPEPAGRRAIPESVGPGAIPQTRDRLREAWPQLDAAWRYLVAGGAEALERPDKTE